MIQITKVVIGFALGICLVLHAAAPNTTWAVEPAGAANEPSHDKQAPPRDADKATQKSKKKSGKDLLDEIHRASAPLLAEMAEKHGYRLEPDQVLRRIAPPFPELRAAYYLAGHPSQAKSIPRPPDAMTFLGDGESVKNWGLKFGSGYSLVDVIDAALKIKSQDIEGPAEVLNKRLEGDWVMRPGASDEKVLQELESILQKQFDQPVRLSIAKRVRTVYVARGKYQFTALNNGSNNPAKDAKTPERIDEIEIYENSLSPNGGGGSGDFKEFLEWVGRWIDMTIIDEVSDPPDRDVCWHLNEGDIADRGNKRDRELVLKHVAAQTGLTFQKELRVIRRVLVEPIE